MSYKIKRKTTLPRALRESHFTNYEQARSSVRKYIRANYQTQPRENPPIGLYGFSVVAV
jgi:hypothetical protein